MVWAPLLSSTALTPTSAWAVGPDLCPELPRTPPGLSPTIAVCHLRAEKTKPRRQPRLRAPSLAKHRSSGNSAPHPMCSSRVTAHAPSHTEGTLSQKHVTPWTLPGIALHFPWMKRHVHLFTYDMSQRNTSPPTDIYTTDSCTQHVAPPRCGRPHPARVGQPAVGSTHGSGGYGQGLREQYLH